MHICFHKVKRKDFMFMLFIITCLVYYAWNYTTLESYLQITKLKYAAVLFFVVMMLDMKKTVRQWIFTAIIIALAGINFIVSGGDANLLLLSCIAVSSDKDKMKHSINAFWYIKVIALIITIFGTLIGIIENKVIYKNESVFSFGFATHNGLVLTLFIILSLYFLKKGQKEGYYIKNIEMFFWTTIILAAAFLTKSKTGSIVSMLFLCLLLIYKYFHINRILEFVAVLCFPILFLLSYYIPGYLGNPIVKWIDRLLNSRLLLSAGVIANSSIGFFHGSLMFPEGGVYRFLDSGYLVLLYSGGIVISVLFVLGYITLVLRAKEEKNYVLLIACICFSIYAFAENILCSFATNYFPVFIYLVLEGKKNEYQKRRIIVKWKN